MSVVHELEASDQDDAGTLTASRVRGRDDLLFCRVSDSWTILAHPMQFDHDTSAFPLRGQHRDAACRLCDATLGGEYVLDNTMNSIRYFIECGFRF